MTDEEFDIANKRLSSRIGWASMLVFVPWMAGFFAVGVTYRDWFDHHDNFLLLAIGVFIGGFLTAVYFITRWLHKRSGLVCRTCGSKEFLAPNGQCWNCNGLPREVRRLWPVTVIIGLAGGAVGTIASRNPVRFGSLWLAGFVLVCVGVWWTGRDQRKKEHPESIADSKGPPVSSLISLFIAVPLLIAVGFGLVDTIASPHAVRNGLLWLAALVVASVGGAWLRRKQVRSAEAPSAIGRVDNPTLHRTDPAERSS
jgi:membrane protein DedA with SNARE-associated domain